MTTTLPVLTGYEYRLELVRTVLQQHTSLDSAASTDLAAKVLHAIDHVPEHTR